MITTITPTNIISRVACADGLWDFGFLNECLPRGIKFSDVDGRIECKGRFLEIEAKRVGAYPSKGQHDAYRRRAYDDRTTVVYVFGDPQQPTAYQILGVHERPVPITTEGFQRFVSAWVAWAESKPWPRIVQDGQFGAAELVAAGMPV